MIICVAILFQAACPRRPSACISEALAPKKNAQRNMAHASGAMSVDGLDQSQYAAPFICPCGKDHTPKNLNRRKLILYWMFNAAYDGCLPCVKRCIEFHHIDPGKKSLSGEYTAMSWAIHGRDHARHGTADVVAYLRDLGM